MMEHDDLADWVAVKSGIFSKTTDNKANSLKFICGWNDESSKVAITLHEGSRRAHDQSSKNKVCLLSLKEIYNIHKQFCLIDPTLESSFSPAIKNTGILPSQRKIENICAAIGHYLSDAVSHIGKQIVIPTVFGEEDQLSHYEENIQEFKLRTLESTVENNYSELAEILQLRDKSESLLQLKTVYVLEDEVSAKIFDSLSELYNFRLQPFLELRELAHVKIEEAKTRLKEDIGPSIREKSEKDFEKWTEESLIASEALQQLYLEYYRKTLSLVEGERTRMLEDKKRFGRTAFGIHAKPRLLKLNIQMFQEELKLSNASKAAKEFHRDKIKNQLAYLNCDDHSVYEIQRIADEVTNAQLDVLDAQLDVLNVEENLYKSQLEVLNKEYEDKLEMGIFVDAVEDPDQLTSIENPEVEPNPKVTSLKNKLGKIYRKRAAIRTKKNTLLAEMRKKKEKKEAVVEKNRKAAAITQKRKNTLEVKELPSEKLIEERKKTLQRLKNYKKKAMALETKPEDETEESNHNLTTPPRTESRSRSPGKKAGIVNNDSTKTSDKKIVPQESAKLPPALPPPPPLLMPPPPPPPPPVSIPPPPPPPPPPLSIPPPPPPPPPAPGLSSLSKSKPAPSLANKRESSSSQVLVSENALKDKLSALKKPAEVKPVKSVQPFNLDEILSIRSKLKKPSTEEPKASSRSDHPVDFNTVLHSALRRIRSITEESDGSDRSEDGEFD